MMVKGSKHILNKESVILDSLMNDLKSQFNFVRRIFFATINEKTIFEKDFPTQHQLYTLKNPNHILAPEYTALFQTMKISDPIYYIQRCYRYENPQALRFREFFQFGIESLNIKEVIELLIENLITFLNNLNIEYIIYYNFLTSPEERKNTGKVFSEKTEEFSFLHKLTKDDNLFRGLGYYSGFIFQLHSGNNEFGGGGMYGEYFGFGLGLDRIIALLNTKNDYINLIVRKNKMQDLKSIIDLLEINKIKYFLSSSIKEFENNLICEKNGFKLESANGKSLFRKTIHDIITLIK